jgi:hypothetical protein
MTVRVINFVVGKKNYEGKKCIKIKDKVFEICAISFPFVIHVFSFVAVSFFYNHGKMKECTGEPYPKQHLGLQKQCYVVVNTY